MNVLIKMSGLVIENGAAHFTGTPIEHPIIEPGRFFTTTPVVEAITVDGQTFRLCAHMEQVRFKCQQTQLHVTGALTDSTGFHLSGTVYKHPNYERGEAAHTTALRAAVLKNGDILPIFNACDDAARIKRIRQEIRTASAAAHAAAAGRGYTIDPRIAAARNQS